MKNQIRVSNALADKEEEVRMQLRKYLALVSEYNARKDLYNSLFPRTTAEIRDIPTGSQSSETELDRIVDKRIDLRTQMENSLQNMRQSVDEVMNMIEGLPKYEMTVLIRRYTLGQSLKTVGKIIGYSERHTVRIHDRAITMIAESKL